MPHVPTEHTLLKVGSEGGCIELLGLETDGSWRFRLATQETVIYDLLGEDSPHEAMKPAWVDTWEAALALLDAYPWQELYPLAVHPQFQKLIYQAVSRYHGSHHQHCDEWDRVMQADTH